MENQCARLLPLSMNLLATIAGARTRLTPISAFRIEDRSESEDLNLRPLVPNHRCINCLVSLKGQQTISFSRPLAPKLHESSCDSQLESPEGRFRRTNLGVPSRPKSRKRFWSCSMATHPMCSGTSATAGSRARSPIWQHDLRQVFTRHSSYESSYDSPFVLATRLKYTTERGVEGCGTCCRSNELHGRCMRATQMQRLGWSEYRCSAFRFSELGQSIWSPPYLALTTFRRLTCLHATFLFI
jgi:hypothetical protein